jgi:hypothetical protein
MRPKHGGEKSYKIVYRYMTTVIADFLLDQCEISKNPKKYPSIWRFFKILNQNAQNERAWALCRIL